MVGYNKDGTDHDEEVYKVLRQCQDVNLKLNKEKMSLQVYINTILWGSSVKTGCPTQPQKVRALTEMPAPKYKKELHAFLGIINYLTKFSPGILEACKPLRKLTSSKVTWMLNASYQ